MNGTTSQDEGDLVLTDEDVGYVSPEVARDVMRVIDTVFVEEDYGDAFEFVDEP